MDEHVVFTRDGEVQHFLVRWEGRLDSNCTYESPGTHCSNLILIYWSTTKAARSYTQRGRVFSTLRVDGDTPLQVMNIIQILKGKNSLSIKISDTDHWSHACMDINVGGQPSPLPCGWVIEYYKYLALWAILIIFLIFILLLFSLLYYFGLYVIFSGLSAQVPLGLGLKFVISFLSFSFVSFLFSWLLLIFLLLSLYSLLNCWLSRIKIEVESFLMYKLYKKRKFLKLIKRRTSKSYTH